MLSAVYWVIKKQRAYKPHLFFFSPSHLSSLSLLFGSWTDRGRWERAHQTLERLKMDICVEALFEHETSGGVRPWWRRRSKTTRRYINEVISNSKNWVPVERNNRSNAEAKELDRHGLLHLLHTICSDDLISSRASRWTYPLGCWSTTQGWMIGCDLNGQIHECFAHHCPEDRTIIHVTCTFFFRVHARPDHTAGPDQALFCLWVRDLFWARWFGERSLEADNGSMLLVCRLLGLQFIVKAEICKLFMLKYIVWYISMVETGTFTTVALAVYVML